MFNEYKESEDKEHAKEELLSICDQYHISHFSFLGYFLNNSLAEKPSDFEKYANLVFEYFLNEQSLISKEELLESINICVAHLPDLIIDYPNGKQYACRLID